MRILYFFEFVKCRCHHIINDLLGEFKNKRQEMVI